MIRQLSFTGQNRGIQVLVLRLSLLNLWLELTFKIARIRNFSCVLCQSFSQFLDCSRLPWLVLVSIVKALPIALFISLISPLTLWASWTNCRITSWWLCGDLWQSVQCSAQRHDRCQGSADEWKRCKRLCKRLAAFVEWVRGGCCEVAGSGAARWPCVCILSDFPCAPLK